MRWVQLHEMGAADMTDEQFKEALIGVLGHIGDGLHRIADAMHTENELMAGDTGAEVGPAVDLAGRPIR